MGLSEGVKGDAPEWRNRVSRSREVAFYRPDRGLSQRLAMFKTALELSSSQ